LAKLNVQNAPAWSRLWRNKKEALESVRILQHYPSMCHRLSGFQTWTTDQLEPFKKLESNRVFNLSVNSKVL